MYNILHTVRFECLVSAGSMVKALARRDLLKEMGHCQWGLTLQYSALVPARFLFPACGFSVKSRLTVLLPSFFTMTECALRSVSQVKLLLL